MEVPNQPIGGSAAIAEVWDELFAMRPGHWGGWMLSTFPAVSGIEFLDTAPTKATAAVTIGYSGATIVLEKVDGLWKAVRLTGWWIT